MEVHPKMVPGWDPTAGLGPHSWVVRDQLRAQGCELHPSLETLNKAVTVHHILGGHSSKEQRNGSFKKWLIVLRRWQPGPAAATAAWEQKASSSAAPATRSPARRCPQKIYGMKFANGRESERSAGGDPGDVGPRCVDPHGLRTAFGRNDIFQPKALVWFAGTGWG